MKEINRNDTPRLFPHLQLLPSLKRRDTVFTVCTVKFELMRAKRANPWGEAARVAPNSAACENGNKVRVQLKKLQFEKELEYASCRKCPWGKSVISTGDNAGSLTE